MNAPTITGSLTADETFVTLAVAGYGGFALQVKSTYTGTVTFEGSVDGENFAAMLMTPIGTSVGATSTTGTGIWIGCCVGLLEVRARMSSYTDGTALATLRAVESAPAAPYLT